MNQKPSLEELLSGPFVGVGLGIDVHGEQPNWRKLVERAQGEFQFLEVFTRGDGGIAKVVREFVGPDMPIIYHHENLEIVFPSEVNQEALDAACVNVEALSALWCIEELAYREIDGRYLDFFMPAFLSEESAQVTIEKLKFINDRLPCWITPENPPYQLPVGDMHLLDFMRRITEGAEVPLILDLGHLFSYQLCIGAEPLDHLDKLPLDRVIELHVAGANLAEVNGVTIYEDSHGADVIENVVLDMLEIVAPQCPNLRAVTIEVEDASNERVFDELKRVNDVLDALELKGVAHGA